MVACFRVVTLLSVGLLILTAQSPAHAQPALELEPLLSAPVSAGNEGLLVRFARDSRVPMRWLGHLRHDDPLVRATAARALAATGVTAAIGRLRVALASETDQVAAVEQALGLLLLGDGAHDAYALARLTQADDVSLERGLLLVASVRPATFVAQVRALASAHAEWPLPTTRALARLHATGHADVVRQYEAAVVESGDRRAIEALVRLAIARDLPLDQATLRLALAGTPPPSQLAALAEYVALRHSRPGKPRDRTDYRALVASPWPDLDEGTPDNLVLNELVRRWVGEEQVPVPDVPLTRVSSSAMFWTTRLMSVFSTAERDSLRGHLGEHERMFGERGPRTAPERPVWHPVALMSALPHGLVGSLRRASLCAADEHHERIAEIAYRADGRPASASMPTGALRSSLPPGCEAMAEAMTLLGYEPGGPAHPGTRLIFTRLDGAFAQCHDARPPARSNLSLHDAEISPPEHQEASVLRYPQRSVFRRDRGSVQMEIDLAATGCVSGGWVNGTVTLELDAAAMQSVSRWRFTPARLGGREVPARLVTTATFWLQ